MCLFKYVFDAEERTHSQNKQLKTLLMFTTWHQSVSKTLLSADNAFPPCASLHIHPRNRLDNLLEHYNRIYPEDGQVLLEKNMIWSI